MFKNTNTGPRALSAMNFSAEDRDVQLAFELACGIAPTADVLSRHEMTVEDLRFKLMNPLFLKLFKDAKRTWEADLSAEERIRVKAKMLIEDSLLTVYGIMHDDASSPATILDAFKIMAKVAGVDSTPKAAEGAAGGGVRITFNMRGDHLPAVVSGPVYEVPDQGAAAFESITMEQPADG